MKDTTSSKDLTTACLALQQALKNYYAVQRYIALHSSSYQHPAWSRDWRAK